MNRKNCIVGYPEPFERVKEYKAMSLKQRVDVARCSSESFGNWSGLRAWYPSGQIEQPKRNGSARSGGTGHLLKPSEA